MTEILVAKLQPIYFLVANYFATRVFAIIFIWWLFRLQMCLATEISAFSDRFEWSLKVIF